MDQHYFQPVLIKYLLYSYLFVLLAVYIGIMKNNATHTNEVIFQSRFDLYVIE